MAEESSKGIWVISESNPDYAEIEGDEGSKGGEGKISLLGTGGKAEGKGAITLKFKRQA